MLRTDFHSVFSLLARLIGLGAALASAVFYLWKKHVARNWPTQTGQVENYHVEDDFTTFLLYSYEVDGQFYSGERALNNNVRSTDHAEEIAAPWLKRKIIVRVNPGHPEQSICLTSDQPEMFQ
jgi:hypothetical protein